MRAFAFFLTCVLAGAAAAAPFAVEVGEARIGLDAPPGFSDTSFTGSPRLQELAESLTSASNRILLFGISDADLRRFSHGDTPEFRRYMLVVTPKGLEREHVGRGAFAAFVSESLRELGAPPAEANFAKYLSTRPAGQASLLSELRREAETVSVLQGARLAGGARQDAPQLLLSTTTLMLVRGKALNLSVYTGYESEADVDWIRATTARWIEQLQRLNGRSNP